MTPIMTAIKISDIFWWTKFHFISLRLTDLDKPNTLKNYIISLAFILKICDLLFTPRFFGKIFNLAIRIAIQQI